MFVSQYPPPPTFYYLRLNGNLNWPDVVVSLEVPYSYMIGA